VSASSTSTRRACACAVREQPPDPFRAIATSVLALATPLLPLRLAVSWTLAAPTIAKGAITLIEDGVRVDVLDGSA
jgi:hypothetical protein